MNSRQIALCGLLTALAVTFLLLGGILPGTTFCAPMLAMAVLLPVLEEMGSRAAGTTYAAAAILGVLLAADRETALVYAFFGWYPILRPRIAALPSRILRLAVKLLLCNAVILLLYGLVLRLMGLTADLLESTRFFNGLLLVMGNVIFLLLDRVLERVTLLWRRRFRRRFFR